MLMCTTRGGCLFYFFGASEYFFFSEYRRNSLFELIGVKVSAHSMWSFLLTFIIMIFCANFITIRLGLSCKDTGIQSESSCSKLVTFRGAVLRLVLYTVTVLWLFLLIWPELNRRLLSLIVARWMWMLSWRIVQQVVLEFFHSFSEPLIF